MKKILLFNLLFIFLFGSITTKAQDITFVPRDTLIVDTLNADIAFYIDVTNVSMQDQTVYLVRTQNDLPAGWQSSLCFDFCWAPQVDSIATTPDYQSTPLTPGEHREVSMHIFPQNNSGTAHVQIRAGTFRSPNVTYMVNLTAMVLPTSMNDDLPALNEFSLSQNYPNPFNPSTKIKYTIPSVIAIPLWREKQSQLVSLKVFDILGNEVASLVNEEKEPGTYEVEFNPASNIRYPASGIYLYRLSVGGFTQSRKMILEK